MTRKEFNRRYNLILKKAKIRRLKAKIRKAHNMS